MSNPLLLVFVGGLLAIVGGLFGQMYVARAQLRHQRQVAEVSACEELFVILGRLRAEKIYDSYLSSSERRDTRPLREQEAEEGRIDDSITLLCVRVQDRELRAAIGRFVECRERLYGLDQYVELVELLRKRCGGVMRGDRRLVDLSKLHQALDLQKPA